MSGTASSGQHREADFDRDLFQLERHVLPAGDMQFSPTAKHHICLHIGVPAVTCRSLDGRTQQRIQHSGDFDIVPAGMAGRWRNEQPVELIVIGIDPAFSAEIGDDPLLSGVIVPALQLRDRQLHHLALALIAEHQNSMATGPIYAESLMTALLMRLTAVRNGEMIAPAKNGHCFSIRQQRQLAEFIEANISSDLSLSTLAAFAGYGLSRFKTLFKSSFGCTPHSYVTKRRIERAKALIEKGALPLSEIALEAGFSHQSHMAAMFRQSLGISPGELRRLIKG